MKHLDPNIASRVGRRLFEAPLYTTGIALYRFGVRVAALNGGKARKLDRGQHDVAERIRERIDPKRDRVIWIHAASLGEFEQGRPLMERIRVEHPEYKILLTFFSPSGYEVRKDFPGADCVCYLPFDTPGRVRRFLDLANPEMAIFVKYEIWRNYLSELSKRNIPAYLISAVFRREQFFIRHRDSWYGRWFQWYRRIFVQDVRSRDLLSLIGYKNAEVAGDTRFDRVEAVRETRKPIPGVERFLEGHSGPVLMAGSSWPKDEDVYAPWVDAHPDVKVIIAPHEFDAPRLDALKQRFGNGVVLLSEIAGDSGNAAGSAHLLEGNPQVLVMDCFGLLSSAYAYCNAAYVGGGFGAGLHNINEAAVYDVPVIYGPNHSKFIEAREMAEAGGGFPVSSREEFESVAEKLLGQESAQRRLEAGAKAGAYIRSKLGATDRIYRALFG